MTEPKLKPTRWANLAHTQRRIIAIIAHYKMMVDCKLSLLLQLIDLIDSNLRDETKYIDEVKATKQAIRIFQKRISKLTEIYNHLEENVINPND